jgi:hypothetical protein
VCANFARAIDKARLEGYHADDLDTDRGLPCACRIEEDTQDNWTEIRVCGKHQQERARTRALVEAARDALSWLSDAAPEVIDRTLRTLLDEEE